MVETLEQKIAKRKMYVDKYMFGGLRESVLKRDGYKCLHCGMTDAEHRKKWGKSIEIDHIDGFGSRKKIKHNWMSNLQTLCRICHAKKGTPPKEKCKNGHEFTPENTRMRKSNGQKVCRACNRTYNHKYERKLTLFGLRKRKSP